ncbi:hypothetical protein [Streptosporangium roseum]|uniref:hypothetical protein n=1 Tax=Streptosporangium roseum TaxID=2001 RepID=UPI00068941C8|nr:hypothetical protein [Streptosporangium roseum]
MTTHETPGLAVRLRRTLADRLARTGSLHDPAWRDAVEAVPRERFLGSAVARGTEDGAWQVTHRAEVTEDEWLHLVYRDETWVTQIDGSMVEGAHGTVSGAPTSSSTLPGLVVLMLEAAGISDGDKVLEVGTGTGYSAALMCHRLGSHAVTSVEYDPAVAGRARDALTAAGRPSPRPASYAVRLPRDRGYQGEPGGSGSSGRSGRAVRRAVGRAVGGEVGRR